MEIYRRLAENGSIVVAERRRVADIEVLLDRLPAVEVEGVVADRGGLSLTRSTSATSVYGGSTPGEWRCTITSPGPSEMRTTQAAARLPSPAEHGARGALTRP